MAMMTVMIMTIVKPYPSSFQSAQAIDIARGYTYSETGCAGTGTSQDGGYKCGFCIEISTTSTQIVCGALGTTGFSRVTYTDTACSEGAEDPVTDGACEEDGVEQHVVETVERFATQVPYNDLACSELSSSAVVSQYGAFALESGGCSDLNTNSVMVTCSATDSTGTSYIYRFYFV